MDTKKQKEQEQKLKNAAKNAPEDSALKASIDQKIVSLGKQVNK